MATCFLKQRNTATQDATACIWPVADDLPATFPTLQLSIDQQASCVDAVTNLRPVITVSSMSVPTPTLIVSPVSMLAEVSGLRHWH